MRDDDANWSRQPFADDASDLFYFHRLGDEVVHAGRKALLHITFHHRGRASHDDGVAVHSLAAEP